MPDDTQLPQPTPLYRIPEAVALDFDRTLANNDACMERLYRATEGLPDIDTAKIRKDKLEVEAAKETFDVLGYIQRALIPEGHNPDRSCYEEFCMRFVQMQGLEVLYDDATRFLDMLQQADVPHIILTYGNNIEWQLLKLQAAGYPASKKIMQDSNKGAQIKSYQQQDGKFHFRVIHGGEAEYIAEQMALVDDKSTAFNEFPQEYSGFKIIRGQQLPSQEGPIPDNVTEIHSLDELTVVGGRLRVKEQNDTSPDDNFARRWTKYGPTDVRQRVPQDSRTAIYVPISL